MDAGMFEFARQIMMGMMRVRLQQRLLAIDDFYTCAGLCDTEHLDTKNKLKLKAYKEFVDAFDAANSAPTAKSGDNK